MNTPPTKLDAREARKEMYKGLILEAAERQFATHGYDQTKVQDIATTADLSLVTLYNTFKGKDNVYEAVHLNRMSELVQFCTGVLNKGATATENLLKGIEALVQYFLDHPNYLMMHLRDGSSWATESGIDPGHAMDQWHAGITMLEQLVSVGKANGELVDMDSRLMAQSIVALVQVWLSRWAELGMPETDALGIKQLNAQIKRAYMIEGEKT